MFRLRLGARHLALAGAGAVGSFCVAAKQSARSDASPSQSVAAGTSGKIDQLLGRVASIEKALLQTTNEKDFIVVSPTFYPNLSDQRCQLGLESCRRARALGIRLLLVDASPPEVQAALEEAGAMVHRQTWRGRKGAALRECIDVARTQLAADGVICFQELEKVEMIGLQRQVAAHILHSGCDICVPRREDSCFRRSYPIEQYHQEHFANLYLDALGAPAGLPALDWTFGPVGLRASAAHHWLESDGEMWDAQIVPFIRAARWCGARVESLQVNYSHPMGMKREEEGEALWGEKRLMQLNFLFEHVASALKEAAPPRK